MADAGDVKAELAKHLTGIGYELSAPREAILEKLRHRMGAARFQQLAAVLERPRSASRPADVYALFRDVTEANLIRSLSPGPTLELAHQLYCAAAPTLEPGVRVTELGCWTGGLASFIAARHPGCVVTGVHGAQQLVDACAAHYDQPNLTFRRWDCRAAKPPDLEPADVMLCSLAGVARRPPEDAPAPDLAGVRRTRDYVLHRERAAGYFAPWRSAARDGGLLFLILREWAFPRFLAWLDAAQAAGWTPLLERLCRVDVPGAVLQRLAFQAGGTGTLDEGAVVDRWAWLEQQGDVYACLKEGEALAAFRVLAPRRVLAEREYRRDGALTRDEVGWTAGAGYVFTHDVVSRFRLLLVSRGRAKFLAGGVSAEGSRTPITDEALFQEGAATPAQAGRATGAARSGNPFYSGAARLGPGEPT